MSSYHFAVNDETGEIVFLVGMSRPLSREVADRLLDRVGLRWEGYRILCDSDDRESDDLDRLYELEGYVHIAPRCGVDNLSGEEADALRVLRRHQELD